jgi:hypothetical protein
MSLKRGDSVGHPKKPEWGEGQVLGIDGTRVRVFFSIAGEKTVDEKYVPLTILQSSASHNSYGVRVLATIDYERVRQLCSLFVSDLKDNRSTYNDASLAEHVMQDLERSGKLSRTTMRQLAAWCTTNGSVFQKGVPIAQDISFAIFGRVLRREDVGGIG